MPSTGSNSHSYTHLILALGIVRKPTVCVFVTSNYPGTHDIGLPTSTHQVHKPQLNEAVASDVEGRYTCSDVDRAVVHARPWHTRIATRDKQCVPVYYFPSQPRQIPGMVGRICPILGMLGRICLLAELINT